MLLQLGCIRTFWDCNVVGSWVAQLISCVQIADIKQILLEAKHRWLRPAEICEILRNYEKFHISPEAPNKPVSMSSSSSLSCVHF